MTAVAGKLRKGFRHEGRPQAVVLGDGFHHVLEEHVAIRRHQCIGVIPVHLELAVGIFVVVLVRVPAELDHAIADLADDVEAAHQRRLVVTGLFLGIALVGYRGAVGIDQEVLALDTRLHVEPARLRLLDLALQRDAGRGLHRLAGHPQIPRQPCHLGLPWQLDEAVGIGDGEHVGIRRRHVQPRGESSKSRAVLLHLPDGPRRNQLRAQHAEQIHEADEKVFYALGFRDLIEINGHD